MSRVSYFKRQCYRELLLNRRKPQQWLHSMVFFLMITVFFPLTMPPEWSLMRQIAPGLVWIATLLAFFMSSLSWLQQDEADGVIEQWLVSDAPLTLIVHAKLWMHWLVNALPMLCFCPLLALLFHFSFYETIMLMVSLLLGTPGLLFLSGLASAFSAGKGILMALILFPLTIPIMIFGSGSVTTVMEGFSASGYLAMLAALSLLAVSFLPFAMAFVIRISLVE